MRSGAVEGALADSFCFAGGPFPDGDLWVLLSSGWSDFVVPRFVRHVTM